MESLKLAGESSVNTSDASSSPLAAVGLVGRPPDELGKGVQSALASVSLESQIRDETMLCEQGEFTKNSVEGVAIANNLQSVLEQPSADLYAKPSFCDMVMGLGNGAGFTSTIPELDVEDNCLTSEEEKSGDTIIDMNVVEPVEKFGIWMQVTSKRTRRNSTGQDDNTSLYAGTTGPNVIKGRYEVLRLQEGVPVMRSASSELRVRQRAKEHTVAPGKRSESHVMKAKQVLWKGSGSVSKGGNRPEKEISEIVPMVHVVKPPDRKENMDPNTVDVGEWARELSKKLSIPMPSENGDTRSVQLVETNAEADGPIGNDAGLEKIMNSS
ncbi:hypothetical protein V6N13_109662 [Hibiscus sabdariffa]|uniref:Uncharacterized protein n=1 Tax=Hibiscus sabdariffa TaxID=183260 RepID=A0ABR2FQX8_9ROSI